MWFNHFNQVPKMLWYTVPSNAYLKHQVSSVIHAVQPHCTPRLLSHKDNWLLQSLCPTFKWLQQSFRLSFSPGFTGRSGPHVSLLPPKKSSPLQDSLPAPTVLAWSQYYAESTISSAPQSIALPGAKYCKVLQSIAKHCKALHYLAVPLQISRLPCRCYPIYRVT